MNKAAATKRFHYWNPQSKTIFDSSQTTFTQTISGTQPMLQQNMLKSSSFTGREKYGVLKVHLDWKKVLDLFILIPRHNGAVV